jgi:hypothetical protein
MRFQFISILPFRILTFKNKFQVNEFLDSILKQAESGSEELESLSQTIEDSVYNLIRVFANREKDRPADFSLDIRRETQKAANPSSSMTSGTGSIARVRTGENSNV